MNERIEEELKLLRHSYSEVEYVDAGQWVKIKDYPTPPGSALEPPNDRCLFPDSFRISRNTALRFLCCGGDTI